MALIARKRRIDSSIDLTPLIDVVFQLLIFLMVSSQFTKPDAVVDLPQASGEAGTVDANKDKISLAIQADGKVLLDNEPVAMEALGAAVRTLVDGGVKRAEIRGDRLSHYGIFVEVMETAREQGVDTIGIVKKKQEGTDR